MEKNFTSQLQNTVAHVWREVRYYGPMPGRTCCSFSEILNHLRHIVVVQGPIPEPDRRSAGNHCPMDRFWSEEGAPRESVQTDPENVTGDHIVFANAMHHFENST